MNSQIGTFFDTTPGAFQNTDVGKQEPSGDRSHNDSHPRVEISSCRASNLTDSDPNETSHMVTGAQEVIPYCFPGISSGKQKKAHSTDQPQFCSENASAAIEADQILLALRQLASNSNFANFNNNIDRISKFP